jgi:uncharacterized protein (TIGR03083 family)
MRPVIVIHLFPGEREALLKLLAELSPMQWASPTACPGWSVHDITLHLLADDIGRLSRGRDGFRHPRREPAPTDWEGLVAFINRQNQEWLTVARRISPRLACDFMRVTGDATAAYFAQLDQLATGGPVDWAGPDPAPVWLDVAREYTERWVHQQHIRDAVGQPGMKEPRWFAPVLDTFAHGVPHTLRVLAPPPGTTVRLTVTGEAGGTWDAVRTGEQRWVLADDVSSSPQAIVRIDQDLAWRLFTRGLSPDDARERVTLEGDPALGGRVLETVSIIA